MLEILLYALGIMYTPGPVNFIGLNSGIQRQTREMLGFFAGVGIAMFILFSSLAKIGSIIISGALLHIISFVGCAYILYLAYKILKSSVNISKVGEQTHPLSFKEGLFIQLMNPKGMIAAMPVSTVQFPAAGITGWHIAFWSLGLAVLAFGAPFAYSVAGSLLGKRIKNPVYFRYFNLMMASLLFFVAVSMGYEQIIHHTF
ncbi:transporter [Vibrio sp. HA2012]|uniref:LysE family translocator n=1 Tax=Vibrio sp. HA2012 TaxID=1971595 RepID=UPI000C2B9FCC|nr:LysE family transporter [Vibrio sp. HA2012]PJC86883.1 transporter [Vibrio sp. HA2012]